jgi:light-regulated signal transduction histidine kinase (bacteriophytochrome)
MEETNKISFTNGGLHEFNPHRMEELSRLTGSFNKIPEADKPFKSLKTTKKTVSFAKAHKSKKKEANTNAELSSFNYLSSHDLQEPLRKIRTFSSRILEKEQQNLSDSGKDYFQRMQNAAVRMQTIIEDLLELSKMNTSERQFEKTDLAVIVEQVKNDLEETIREKKSGYKL